MGRWAARLLAPCCSGAGLEPRPLAGCRSPAVMARGDVSQARLAKHSGTLLVRGGCAPSVFRSKRVRKGLLRNPAGFPEGRRAQAVTATPGRGPRRVSSTRAVCRGRSLSRAATASSRLGVTERRSVPFGKYWRKRPLVFSFVPRCQGLCGSQKYDLHLGPSSEREAVSTCAGGGHSLRGIAESLGQAASTLAGSSPWNGARSAGIAPGAVTRTAYSAGSTPQSRQAGELPRLRKRSWTMLIAHLAPERLPSRLDAQVPRDSHAEFSPTRPIYRSLFDARRRGKLRESLARYLRRQRSHSAVAHGPGASRIDRFGQMVREFASGRADAFGSSCPRQLGASTSSSGSTTCAMATLVERKSRFVMLVPYGPDEASGRRERPPALTTGDFLTLLERHVVESTSARDRGLRRSACFGSPFDGPRCRCTSATRTSP